MSKRLNLDTSEKLAITTRRGDSFDVTLTFFTGAEAAGNEDSLDGDTFIMEVRDSPNSDGDVGVVLSSNSGGFTFDIGGASSNTAGINNQLTVRATAATMRLVNAGRYVYDLQRLNSSTNEEKTILRGAFKVIEDVSEPLAST
tara:strand:- start:1844 stop:2272 length:429 start_codon:yes stop_codon:yes gene_type:complete